MPNYQEERVKLTYTQLNKLNKKFFVCAHNYESLVNSLFGVKIFNPFSSFTSSSTFSNGGMSDKSTDSSLSVYS